ncbi:hypothetical protein TNCV_4645931 [Trichonephila clavipes]|nr:hypothetical protein TNCV_4645931 [Trichonephila clavipes]
MEVETDQAIEEPTKIIHINQDSEITLLSKARPVKAAAEWYRYRIVACLATSPSSVAPKAPCVGQRCTLNLSRAETSSRWTILDRVLGAREARVHYRLFSVWTLVPVRLDQQLSDHSTVDEIASGAADCRPYLHNGELSSKAVKTTTVGRRWLGRRCLCRTPAGWKTGRKEKEKENEKKEKELEKRRAGRFRKRRGESQSFCSVMLTRNPKRE